MVLCLPIFSLLISNIVYTIYTNGHHDISKAETVIAYKDYGTLKYDADSNHKASCRYHYEVNGKTYKFWVRTWEDRLTEEMPLYYVKGRPQDATTEQYFCDIRHPFLKSYLISFLIVHIIYIIAWRFGLV